MYDIIKNILPYIFISFLNENVLVSIRYANGLGKFLGQKCLCKAYSHDVVW